MGFKPRGCSALATPVHVRKHPNRLRPFQPLVYTLDLLIPGGLGQRTAWYWSNGSLQCLAYLLIAFGWVLTTAVNAGVTRILQKG